MTPVSPYVTRPLSPGTWDDFARLVEANNGVWGGCWCMGFHPEGVGKGHTVSGNRLAKQARVRNGTVHQILVYDGDECVGWCQYGPPAELPNIKNPKAYAKGLGEMPDWRIGCIFTGSGHRRSGVARAALRAALAAIHDAGGGLVEAYPEQAEGRAPQRGAYFHTGPADLFEVPPLPDAARNGGYFAGLGAVRVYRIDRIQSAAAGGEQFRAPGDLDYVGLLEQHLARCEWHTRYQRPCRTTTAHGSTSSAHCLPDSLR